MNKFRKNQEVEIIDRNKYFFGPDLRKSFLGKIVVGDQTGTFYYVQTWKGDIDKVTEDIIKPYDGPAELSFPILQVGDLVSIISQSNKKGIVKEIFANGRVQVQLETENTIVLANEIVVQR